MWHVATADAATVAPAHALHSSQDIRYISRFHTGNPIGTWLCSISKLTILNFSFNLFFILFSIFYSDFFEFFKLFRFVCSLQKKIVCLLNISFDFLMFFSHFFFVFLFILFGKLQKKIQRTLSVLFVILSFFLFWNVEMFCGNWTRRRSSFGWWSLDFSILDSRSGSGWESADTKRTPRANETQCEQQVRVQMRPQLEATRGGCPSNTNMFERVARYTVTPLLPALLTRLEASLRDAVRRVWREWTRLRLRRLGGRSTASCTWRTKRTYEGIICWQSGWIRCLTALEQLDARSVSNRNSLMRLDQCGSIDLFAEFQNSCLVLAE